MEGTWVQMKVECVRCRANVDGAMQFDSRNTVIDSRGFMLFGEGVVCDRCLGQ